MRADRGTRRPRRAWRLTRRSRRTSRAWGVWVGSDARTDDRLARRGRPDPARRSASASTRKPRLHALSRTPRWTSRGRVDPRLRRTRKTRRARSPGHGAAGQRRTRRCSATSQPRNDARTVGSLRRSGPARAFPSFSARAWVNPSPHGSWLAAIARARLAPLSSPRPALKRQILRFRLTSQTGARARTVLSAARTRGTEPAPARHRRRSPIRCGAVVAGMTSELDSRVA